MSGLVLYHSPRCPYARRVRIVLEHLQVSYADVEIDPGRPPADFRSVSAYGMVPALVHDGQNLYESNIINEYLDETFHGGLMPDAPLDRARVRILMHYADAYWMPAVTALKEAVQGGAKKETVRERQADVLKRLRELETRFIGGGPYLTGAALTLADIAFAPMLLEVPLYGMHVPHALTRAKRWAEALAELPAVTRVPPDPAPIAGPTEQRRKAT